MSHRITRYDVDKKEIEIMPDETYPDSPPPGQYPTAESEVYATKEYESTNAMVRGGGMSLGHRRNPNVRAIVTAQIAELKKEIEVREAVLKNLDENPGIEKTLDSLRKIGV